MTHIFFTPYEVAKQIASSAKEKRLSLNLTQKSLSDRSGVSLGALKRFERTGKISLESLLKLSVILGNLENFANVFKVPPETEFRTIKDLYKKYRQRGRK